MQVHLIFKYYAKVFHYDFLQYTCIAGTVGPTGSKAMCYCYKHYRTSNNKTLYNIK